MFHVVRKQPVPTADDFLHLAVHTGSPAVAGAFAAKGLRGADAEKVDPETALLLFREVYRAHLYARRLRSAHAVARKMVRLGVAHEIAHVDLGRACASLGWWSQAAQAYRIAARNAPASRRAMHWSSVAAALHHAGQYDDALSALERAVRWSLGSRPLHRASMALVQLDAGVSPEELEGLGELMSELECSRAGEGYGRYVLGLLYAARGDGNRAARHLKHFIKRNAHDPMRSTTLAAELRRARRALRELRMQGAPTPASPNRSG
jgi:tetratricopeptide (TPR) repeat protein